MTVPQITLLQLLSRYNRLKVCEISEMMSIKDSTTSRIIDRLEDGKLVTRLRSKDDKRVVFIELTKEGYTVVNNLKKISMNLLKLN
ncbi:MarR family transcriptional regulator [Sporosalibacterium faouarense]|uniref:MarR family transcriptional regulator n=1 Tax=Sporosalibacterium faouarense TaxID=516123 RepID=UPI00192AEE86